MKMMQTLRVDAGVTTLVSAPVPTPADDEVLIRVTRAGVCNTDLELIGGYYNYSGVLGHEFVGVVESAGAAAPAWIGQRVVGEINIGCGACDMCTRSIVEHCRRRRTLGINQWDGVFAEFVVLPARNLHRVPETISDDQAVFTEPLAAACSIPERVQLAPGMQVVVLGAGKLGLLIAQVLRLSGADVRVATRRERTAALVCSWGMTAVDAVSLPDQQADIVVECTGNAEGFALAQRLVEPRGTIVLKSTYTGTPNIALSRAVVDEVRLVGSRCGPFAPALRLLAQGLVETAPLIDARYPLSSGLAALADAATPGRLKVLLEPG